MSKKAKATFDHLVRIDGFRCHYCKRILTRSTATRDHRIPRSRGGPDHLGNIVLSCYYCNNAKKDMTDEEFFAIPYEERERLRLRSSRA